MRSTRMVPALFVVLAVMGLVAGCGSSDDDSAAAAKSTADSIKKQIDALAKGSKSSTPFGTAKQQCPKTGASAGRMRVVNLAIKDGKAIGAVDVYAGGYTPDLGCKPLLKAVGYGDVSNYIDVPTAPYTTTLDGTLAFYDAGTTTRNQGFWKGDAPPDGVQGKDDQETVILTGGTDQGQATPTWTNVDEKSTKSPDTDVKVASGKSLLLVSPAGANSAVGQGDHSEFALTIDGKCLGGDPQPDDPSGSGPGLLNGNGVPFTVEPGSHTLGYVVTPSGTGIGGEDCDGHTPAFTTTVDVDAGRALAVYLGGTSSTHLTITSAIIDQ